MSKKTTHHSKEIHTRTGEAKDVFCADNGTNYKDVVKMRPFQPQFNFKKFPAHATPTEKPSSKKG